MYEQYFSFINISIEKYYRYHEINNKKSNIAYYILTFQFFFIQLTTEFDRLQISQKLYINQFSIHNLNKI